MWGEKRVVLLSSFVAAGAMAAWIAVASEKLAETRHGETAGGKPPAAELVCFDDGGLKPFDHAAELLDLRDKLVHGQLNPLGAEARKLLAAINEGAHGAKDYQSADHALRARENFLLARLYAARFLDSNDMEDAARVEMEFAELYRALETLDASLAHPEPRELLAAAAANLPLYKQAFDQVVEIGRRAMEVRASAGARPRDADAALQALNSI